MASTSVAARRDPSPRAADPRVTREDPSRRPKCTGTAGSDPEPSPDLLRLAREGEREALGRLLRSVQPLVYRWCLARTGDPVDAEDLSQDVLVKAVRGLNTYRGSARFTTWLFGIVRNTAISRHRRRRPHGARGEELPEELPASLDGRALETEAGPPLGPEAAVDRDRLLARVRASFRSLTPRQREVFQLVELEGWTAVEAAGRLEIAPATARVLLLRARRTIREDILRTDPELVEAYFE